ncbi:7-cyano-7-deazaguanine synthase [Altererythrobacter atlanticus]|uniref:7-cyano-7-deazaguanine synthase n=1 Tax=Croceibacterium atlanticum TaxID=1267766 RepID=A0A0F7KWA1_9SPHN|nr:7-cyano-7-deazaguanine synthase QueC [Croceibacterium atlanticum]AKH43472.1 7-cyano-7-deazaguanine synthase [Croceibacterium atlanticum]MBB5731820.1 7-cyano-7-deazaguanine synthase [Croceibacterium atlanticum]
MSDHTKTETRRNAVVLLSGGLDSMVAGGIAREQGFAINALTIDYNQRHRCEIEAAKTIAKELGAVRHVILPLDLRQFGGSALTDDIAVPKTGLTDDIPVTYVPARNLIFLSLTLGWAEPIGAHDIFIGVNALDYSGYPDCRPEFIASFTDTATLATKEGAQGHSFTIQTPLQFWGKARIAQECQRLGLDPAMSWSCYDPTPEGMACGLCDSCRLRRKGMEEAGVVDRTEYAATPAD